MMSSENLQWQSQSSQILNPFDCFRILDKLFQNDQSPQSIDAVFKHFEANFKTQPFLVNSILDYYFDHSNKSPSLNDPASNTNLQLCLNQNGKTIIDLIFLIPDDLASKVFDRVGEKLNNSPSSSSSATGLNVISAQHAWLKTFEKSLSLLSAISYHKKNWVPKLLLHNLFPSLVKLLKVNSNLNDQIIVESSLFFVTVISMVPLQIMNSHLDSVFQTFLSLFKHFTYLEQSRVYPDGVTWRSVKWSIRLLFYACYGLFPTQFIQNFRKKDHHLINKEFIRSTSFYLRFHPSLMRDKNDSNEKQLKQTAPNCDDYSLEWRQYCLDPICTNYNQVIQEIGRNCNPTTSAFRVSRLGILNTNSPLIGNQSITTDTSGYVSFPPPISPSNLFSSSNLRTTLQEVDLSASLKKSTNTTLSNQSSMPSTPNLLNQSGLNVFQYPAQPSNLPLQNKLKPSMQLNNNSIKNLTLEFMVNETEMKGDWMMASNDDKFSTFIDTHDIVSPRPLSRKHRSNSDSNLVLGGVSELATKKARIKNESEAKKREGQVFKPVIRDQSVKEPASLELFDHSGISTRPDLVQTGGNAAFYLGALTSDSSFTLTNESLINESNDMLAAYLSGLKQNQSVNEANTSPNQTIARLKQDLNHLAIQLVYERHLRNKYEEDSNRLHFIKIQCDQLKEEKNHSEKNLREMVEKYKREVEESLNGQNRVELDAYKSEMQEKELLIENIQQRLNITQLAMDELNDKFESVRSENKRLEKENGKLMQLLEREQNLKSKNEIDQSYLKSLRYTTDLLRKKLLIMSKSQQELYQGFSNELADLAQIYNSPLFSALANKDQMFQIDSLSGEQLQMAPSSMASSIILTPLYQFQQATIEMQQRELDQLRLGYKNLMAKYDESQLVMETCQNNLTLKDKKIDELNEKLEQELVDMNAELIKNHSRIHSSLMNVNKRLEEEVFKLKANLNELTVKNERLNQQLKQTQENGTRVLRDCEGNLVGPNDQ